MRYINEMKIYLTEGGEGSGNFGHTGRPGEVGGSSKNTNYSDTQVEAIGLINQAKIDQKLEFPNDFKLKFQVEKEYAKWDKNGDPILIYTYAYQRKGFPGWQYPFVKNGYSVKHWRKLESAKKDFITEMLPYYIK